ncbi:MAG: cation transporter, partial [Alphaproteobacteria bacterium]|nr:cation transporter [Alphaproteobacteria bacterium]
MHDVAEEKAPTDPTFARILWLALVANFAMFVIEGTAGVLANSSSLQADAIDALADGMTYALTLYVAARSLLWR